MIFRAACLALMMALPVAAQDGLTALARIRPEASTLTDTRGGVDLRLMLSQPVPYRVFTLDGPPRLVLDFSEVDWAGLDPLTLDQSAQVTGLRVGQYRPGWSRMVLDLAGPLAVEQAELRTGARATGGEGAEVVLRLIPTDPASFAATAGAPDDALTEIAAPDRPIARQKGDGPLRVVLDPGHGGIDPGAMRDETIEAELMLTFARELREVLLRTGGFEVTLTREGDVFVPLETRITLARAAQADVFISLHADALTGGRATGATVYTLSETASDEAARMLAERHDRDDLLAGVDLTDQDDQVAGILMDLARQETAPRTMALASQIVGALDRSVGVHKRPLMQAGFSVLKAPDIPSVLIELGFLSSDRDRENLTSPDWRAQAAGAIRDALLVWAAEDAAQARLVRQ